MKNCTAGTHCPLHKRKTKGFEHMVQTQTRIYAVEKAPKKTDTLLKKRTHVEGGVIVDVLGRGHDWKCSDLKEAGSVHRPGGKLQYKQLQGILEERNLKHLILSHVKECNAEFIDCKNGELDITIGGNRKEYPVTLYKNSVSGDAYMLPQTLGASIMIRSGDCPSLILSHPKTRTLMVLHCARQSLLCSDSLLGRNRQRPSFSVIHCGLHHLKKELKLRLPSDKNSQAKDINLEDIYAHISCGISAEHFSHPFDHPTYGENNKALINWLIHCKGWGHCIYGDPKSGCLSLEKVIGSQLAEAGLDPEKISTDKLDTYSNPNLWSHVEAVRNNTHDGRNGVLVYRS